MRNVAWIAAVRGMGMALPCLTAAAVAGCNEEVVLGHADDTTESARDVPDEGTPDVADETEADADASDRFDGGPDGEDDGGPDGEEDGGPEAMACPDGAGVGAVCNDGLYCTATDTCNASGLCVGSGDRCSDGHSCTADSCGEATDICFYPVISGNCLIAGTCYAEGAIDPSNPCAACDPGVTQVRWTHRPSGTVCESDSDECTIDTCDGFGTCRHVAGCTDSVVELADRSVRLCVTDAECAAAVGEACGSLNVPGEWTAPPWDVTSNAMHLCASEGYWVFTSGPLGAGRHCYRLYSGSRWFADPAAGAECGTGAEYCDAPSGTTQCRFAVP